MRIEKLEKLTGVEKREQIVWRCILFFSAVITGWIIVSRNISILWTFIFMTMSGLVSMSFHKLESVATRIQFRKIDDGRVAHITILERELKVEKQIINKLMNELKGRSR